MISTAASKGTPTSNVTTTIASAQTYLLPTTNALRADALGNIYIYGVAGTSNVTKYNTATGSSTTLTTLSNVDTMAGWDVDDAGSIYWVAAGAANGRVRAQYGSYPSGSESILFSLPAAAGAATLSVGRSGTVISVLDSAYRNLINYTNWTTTLASNSTAVGATFAQGLSVQSPYNSVYIGCRKQVSMTATVVYVYSSGTVTTQSSNTYGASGIAFDRSLNNVYVAGGTSVYLVTPTGDTTISSGFTNIQGLAVSAPSGVLYVLDYGTGSADGTLTAISPAY
jgi:hypothetical protein